MTSCTPSSPLNSLPYDPASPINHENDPATTIKEEADDSMSILNGEAEDSEPTVKSETESSVSSVHFSQDGNLTCFEKDELGSLFAPSPEPSSDCLSITTDLSEPPAAATALSAHAAPASLKRARSTSPDPVTEDEPNDRQLVLWQPTPQQLLTRETALREGSVRSVANQPVLPDAPANTPIHGPVPGPLVTTIDPSGHSTRVVRPLPLRVSHATQNPMVFEYESSGGWQVNRGCFRFA